MSLVNMKVQKSLLPDGTAGTLMGDQPDYPYGLRISLEDQGLTALGVNDLPKIGADFMITARVKVCGASENPSEAAGQGRRLELQITDLELHDDKEKSDDTVAGRIYTAPISSGTK
jgi:hypothetical protein